MSTRQGWICPRCDKVLSPDVKECSCVLPDLIGKPLPSLPDITPTGWPFKPLGPDFPEYAQVPPTWPMPVCGCTGPCANAACPHRLRVTCAMIPQFSVARTNGVA